MLHSLTLHSGSLVRITDVACRHPKRERGPEEYASSHHVLVPRAGLFVKHERTRNIVAEPMQTLFFSRDEAFRVSHPVDGGDDRTMISCADDVWRELIGPYDASILHSPSIAFAFSQARLPARQFVALERIRGRLRSGIASVLEVEEATLALLQEVIANAYAHLPRRATPRRAWTRRAHRELVEQAKLVIARDPSRTPSLAEVARDLDVSPFHLSRVFHAETGHPVHRYAIRLRLTLALERLLGGDESLTTVALAFGFSSHSHFTTQFRRVFGVSPAQMRRLSSAEH